jgi:hypothetical protein
MILPINGIDNFNNYCKNRWGKNWEDFQPYIEKQKEEELIQLLWKINIQSSIKTNKKSLPFQYTVTQSEDVGNLTQTTQLYRKFIYHLLKENTYKIRFFIETELNYGSLFGPPTSLSYITGIIYHIKYYIHKNQ